MSSAHHAAHPHHDDNEGGFKSQWVGLSIGLLAVIVAVCAGLSNSEKNKMTQTMISQAQATTKEVAASVKLRLILVELEKSTAVNAPLEKGSPTEHDLHLYVDYLKERNIAHQLSEAMTPMVENHYEGTENYERAQLWAEIAIALASMSMLMKSDKVWYLACALGLVGVWLLTSTSYHLKSHVVAINKVIAPLEEQYKNLRKQHEKNTDDAQIIQKLDPSGKFLNSYQ